VDFVNPFDEDAAALAKREPPARPPATSKNGDPEFLTVKEVAEIVRLHERVVRRAIRRGELRASKPCGRIRIRRADLEAWLKDSELATVPSIHDI
jgi:excisionase family DNA binding protein